jgi:hypothetical protein
MPHKENEGTKINAKIRELGQTKIGRKIQNEETYERKKDKRKKEE